jgi:CBS domain containing-hemolysin-like protein
MAAADVAVFDKSLENSLQQSQQQLSQLQATFARQRQAFQTNPMPAAEQRIAWLNALAALLSSEREALIRAKIDQHPHSTYLVCQGDIDHVVGYLDSKDLLNRIINNHCNNKSRNYV